jgi:hypothetical protein
MKEDIHPVAVRGDRRLDRARIWTRDTVMQWRAVLITRDSISGIPDNISQQCDSCRLTLPTSAVDSLRVGYSSRGGGGGGDDDDDGMSDGAEFLLLSLIILGTLFGPR